MVKLRMLLMSLLESTTKAFTSFAVPGSTSYKTPNSAVVIVVLSNVIEVSAVIVPITFILLLISNSPSSLYKICGRVPEKPLVAPNINPASSISLACVPVFPNTIALSEISTIVEFTVVVVPKTFKLPFIVKTPLSPIAYGSIIISLGLALVYISPPLGLPPFVNIILSLIVIEVAPVIVPVIVGDVSDLLVNVCAAVN